MDLFLFCVMGWFHLCVWLGDGDVLVLCLVGGMRMKQDMSPSVIC